MGRSLDDYSKAMASPGTLCRSAQAAHRRFVVAQVTGTNASNEARTLLEQLSHLKPLEGLYINAHYNGILVRALPHYARQSAGSEK